MAKYKLNFEIVNKSDLFSKYLARLQFLQAIYGDNATIEDINKKNKEIKKGGQRMNEKRAKKILYNALLKFACDEYEKENVLKALEMSEKEFNELTAEYGEIYFCGGNL